MSKENEMFGGFNWEDNNDDDFFGINPTVVTPTVEVTPKTEEAEPEPKPQNKPEESEEEEDYFDLPTSTTNEQGEPNQPEQGSDNIYLDLFNDLKEAQILKHVALEEGEVITPERLLELQAEDNEIEISNRIKSWATEDMDEDGKAFIQFKLQGGNTADFFRAYSSSSEIPDGDIEDEEYQDRLIRYNLAQEGWDRDEIEDRIQYLTDTNRKEKVAKKYDEKTKEQKEAEKANLLKQAEDQKKAIKLQEDSFKSNIQTFLGDSEEVSGFKLKAEDKVQLLNFLTKKDHKISDTKSITGFQKKLAEVFQDTSKMVLLAKLISTDFDMSEIEKKVTTKNTKQIKNNLEQRKTLRPSNSGSSLKGSSLAELFN